MFSLAYFFNENQLLMGHWMLKFDLIVSLIIIIGIYISQNMHSPCAIIQVFM